MTGEFATSLPAGPRLNRLIATLICGHTGGMPDSTYPPYSTDIRLAFEAVDAFLSAQKSCKLTIEYPFPEVWVKRNAERFSAGWIPAAYTAEDNLAHALCRAILKAAGISEEEAG